MNADFVPFIRGDRVLSKPRLISSRINGPIVGSCRIVERNVDQSKLNQTLDQTKNVGRTSSNMGGQTVAIASHRYREVTGSNPVEVLNFSGFSSQLLKLRP